jgi:hypothetical protein
MFNWTIREGLIEDNPACMISKRGVEQSRERILSLVRVILNSFTGSEAGIARACGCVPVRYDPAFAANRDALNKKVP